LFTKHVIIRNPNEEVKHDIRIKTYKFIALRFWVESGINVLCGWTQVSLVLYPLVNFLAL